MKSDALGDRMKMYEMEQAGRLLMPLIPIMARIDGRSFSRFTLGLERPYDKRLTGLLIETTKHLVQETGAVCGYTQSDEITLTWYSDNTKSETFFGGRIQKLTSVLASMSTAFFMLRLRDFLPLEYERKLPHFDARVWNVPTLDEGTNCFLWRELDATKNSISMAAQRFFSHKELHGKNGSEKQEMLWSRGVNWNDYPDFFKRGSYVRRRVVVGVPTAEELASLSPKHHARTQPDFTFERTVVERVQLPPLGRVENRTSVIYFGEEPKACDA